VQNRVKTAQHKQYSWKRVGHDRNHNFAKSVLAQANIFEMGYQKPLHHQTQEPYYAEDFPEIVKHKFPSNRLSPGIFISVYESGCKNKVDEFLEIWKRQSLVAVRFVACDSRNVGAYKRMLLHQESHLLQEENCGGACGEI
jgi:hypothetical protein